MTPSELRGYGLTEREEYVILCLDGWFGERKTHDQIGNVLAITAERVRYYERNGREKLPENDQSDMQKGHDNGG